MKELYEALSAFQGECPTIEKNKKSHFGKYADLTAILEAIRPLLSKHGLCLLQTLETLEDGQYLVSRLGHKSGQEIVSKVRIDYKSLNVQQFGSLISYIRRYSLSSMLGLVSDSDVDDFSGINDKDHAFPKEETKFLTKVQIKAIEDALGSDENKNWFAEEMKKRGINSYAEIEQSKFKSLIEYIKKEGK